MQFTFNIPDAQVQRVRDWVRSEFPDAADINPATGEPFGEPDPATLIAEFKGKIRNWIKGQVQQYELLQQHEQVYQNYTSLDVEDV